MHSRSSRVTRSASVRSDSSHQGVFVLPPPSPPSSRFPPSNITYEDLRDPGRAFEEPSAMGSDGGDSGFLRVVRDLRVLDFAVTVLVWGLSRVILMVVDVHEHDIPSVEVQLNATTTYWARDPTINRKELAEQVTNAVLVVASLAIPIAVHVFVNLLLPLCSLTRRIPYDTRDFVLTLLQAVSMEMVVINLLKRMAGRLRPCFYDMCGWQFDVVWDGVTNLCTDASGEKEARQSFPSGHSSLAWSSMLVLTLYLLGRARVNLASRGESIWVDALTTVKLLLSFVPTFAASWVAVSRTTDNWHHYSDVLAGSVIGSVCALIAYTYNYGSVLSSVSAGLPRQELNNRLKRKIHEGEEDEHKTDRVVNIASHR